MNAPVDDEPMPHIAILGAGPIGVEAALYARFLGYEVTVYERGEVAENVRKWAHLTMSGPFAHHRTTLGLAALEAQDPNYRPPRDEQLLTGREYLDGYLLPLAGSDLVEDTLRLKTKVLGVARQGMGKCDVGEDRGERGFAILVREACGAERIDPADVVIDASGTSPQFMGSGGLPAAGETALRDAICYYPPDLEGAKRDEYQGRHTAVVGNSPWAAATVGRLVRLSQQIPDTRCTWIACHLPEGDSQAGGSADRSGITQDSAAPLDWQSDRVTYWPETWVERIDKVDEDRLQVQTGGRHQGQWTFDRVIVHAGSRPELKIHRELQVDLCGVSDAPRRLAELLGDRPDALDGLAAPAGAALLAHPEPGFYIVGSKAYGRFPDFSLRTGYRQIRDIFTQIGERDTLDLYKTIRPSGSV